MIKRGRQEGTSLIPENLHVPEDCRAVSEVLARVGDKWTVLVVTQLGDGSKRFNELRRGLGSVSQRMLTLTLRGLERDGLVTRTVFPTIPPRVDYELTKIPCSRPSAVLASGPGRTAPQYRKQDVGSIPRKSGTEAIPIGRCKLQVLVAMLKRATTRLQAGSPSCSDGSGRCQHVGLWQELS